MVVLRVVLGDLRLLLVVEVPGQVVEVDFLAPVFGINEPALEVSLFQICSGSEVVATYIFSDCATSNLRARRNRSCGPLVPQTKEEVLLRTHKSYGVESLRVPSCFQLHSQLVELGFLLGSCVAWVTTLGVDRDDGEVIVVVLGVKFQGGTGDLCHFDGYGVVDMWLLENVQEDGHGPTMTSRGERCRRAI